MFELRFGKALVVVDCTIADERHLGNSRDSLEVWMEDRLCSPFGLVIAVPVVFGCGIECLFKLSMLSDR